MATLTTEFGIVNLSITELRELFGNNGHSNTATMIENIVSEPTETKTRKAPPKNQPKSDDSDPAELETLHCENGDHDYQRPRSRGRKPTSCKDHRDGQNSDNESDNSDSETENESEEQNNGGKKRQYNRRGNSEDFVPRNPLIDPADDSDLETVNAEIAKNGGKFEFIRVGLKNLDGTKCDFKVVYSAKKNANYYLVTRDGEEIWAKYGSTDEFLAEQGVKRVNQRAKLTAEANLWQKNGKSRVYVNPTNKNANGGGWYINARS